MALTTYPLNDVDYDASDAELFHCTRSSGVFAGEDFACSVTGADNNVTVGPGIGWIRNSRFSGKVVAQKAAKTVNLGVADSTNPRIDAVVIRFDANANATDIAVKHGIPAVTPAAPEVVRTEAIYELHICHVYRRAGATAISVGDLTDLRMDIDYCGRMEDDTTPMEERNVTVDQLPVVPVKKGGTGAATAEQARVNIGAAPVLHHHQHLLENECNNTDINTLLTPGMYWGYTGMTNAAEPEGMSYFEVKRYRAGWLTQKQVRIGSDGTIRIHIRAKYLDATWTRWRRELTNIFDYDMIGSTLPSNPQEGQIFLVPIKKVT